MVTTGFYHQHVSNHLIEMHTVKCDGLTNRYYSLFTLTLPIRSIHSFPFTHSPFQNFKTAVLVLQRKLIKFGEVLVSRYYKLNEIYVERKIVITSYFPDFALQKTSSAVTVMGSTAKSLFLCMWCSWINFNMNIYVFVLCIFI